MRTAQAAGGAALGGVSWGCRERGNRGTEERERGLLLLYRTPCDSLIGTGPAARTNLREHYAFDGGRCFLLLLRRSTRL